MSASPEHRAHSPSAQGADIAAHTSTDPAQLHSENAQEASLQREVEESQPNMYFDSGDKKDKNTGDGDGDTDLPASTTAEDKKEDLMDVDAENIHNRHEFTQDQDNTTTTTAAGEDSKPDSDDESVLSDVDENQFEDFDPANVEIDDRPQLAIDEENLKLIGRHKRSRNADGEWVEKKKHREGRRERRSRKKRGGQGEDEDGSAGDDGGVDGDSGRRRRRGDGEGMGGGRRRHDEDEIDLAALDEPTRRRIELDRLLDASMQKPTKRRPKKQDGIDINDIADSQIEEMRRRMTDAARLDSEAKKAGQPVYHKMAMLSEVVNLLNKTQFVHSLVDPEINLLEAVKFFLEPLDDASLPAYEIRSRLFACLAKLPINKEALIASGIGKVILFYTKSKQTEPHLKRQAEKLMADWTRTVIQRTDDYSKRVYQTADFNPTKSARPPPPITSAVKAAEQRNRELLPPRLANRARADLGPTSYSVVPKPVVVNESKFARPIGATGEERWRKMRGKATRRK